MKKLLILSMFFCFMTFIAVAIDYDSDSSPPSIESLCDLQVDNSLEMVTENIVLIGQERVTMNKAVIIEVMKIVNEIVIAKELLACDYWIGNNSTNKYIDTYMINVNDINFASNYLLTYRQADRQGGALWQHAGKNLMTANIERSNIESHYWQNIIPCYHKVRA